MLFNIDELIIQYIESNTTKEKEHVLGMVPLFMHNNYLRDTLENLHKEHNTLQFPAFNRRVADFKRSLVIAMDTHSAPRGFIA